MMDKRRLLRAQPPGRLSKMVHCHLPAEEYEPVYWFAFEQNLSLSDAVRSLLKCGLAKRRNEKEAKLEPAGETRQRAPQAGRSPNSREGKQ